MGRHTELLPSLSRTTGAGAVIPARLGAGSGGRHPRSLPAFSFWVSLAIVLVTVIAPDSSAQASAQLSAPAPEVDAQHLVLAGDYEPAVVRDDYRVTKRPVAPAAGIPDPGTAKAIAWEMVIDRGWGTAQYDCLVALWQRESNWNVYAHNPSSGAYGIPQALPGIKMASAGADWATNPATQITWGLGYIAARYATPCGAWEHSESKNWY
ncbi:hypothetical protein GCM10022239_25110 [Leifsonia bigeumensis]|uniref:Lytic transglycosylase domain-containing protein n=1 Tax=Leifsonella bigeumensis TaxID=433643 RepID=A0ABP7FW55_9MICO